MKVAVWSSSMILALGFKALFASGPGFNSLLGPTSFLIFLDTCYQSTKSKHFESIGSGKINYSRFEKKEKEKRNRSKTIRAISFSSYS